MPSLTNTIVPDGKAAIRGHAGGSQGGMTASNYGVGGAVLSALDSVSQLILLREAISTII